MFDATEVEELAAALSEHLMAGPPEVMVPILTDWLAHRDAANTARIAELEAELDDALSARYRADVIAGFALRDQNKAEGERDVLTAVIVEAGLVGTGLNATKADVLNALDPYDQGLAEKALARVRADAKAEALEEFGVKFERENQGIIHCRGVWIKRAAEAEAARYREEK